MTRAMAPELRALTKILSAVEREFRAATAPTTTLCPTDGCLIRIKEKCPACTLAAKPAVCACGTRIRSKGAEKCNVCRIKVPRIQCAGCAKWVRTPGEDRCHDCRTKPEHLRCACGRQIRAAGQTECSPCRLNQRRNTIPDEPDTCPVRWVRQANSLIWYPVYEERSEVA